VLKDLKQMYATVDAARELFRQCRVRIDEPGIDDLTQATNFYQVNRCSFSGLTQSGSFSPQASQVRWTMEHIDRLADYTPLMERWRITCLNYQDVLAVPWSGSSPFAFMDPPYDIEGHGLYGDRGSTHTNFDHQTFREDAEVLQVPAMVTLNSSKKMRQLWAGWQQIFFDLDYSMVSHRRYRSKQKARRELILLNYEAP
jgi:DNA adenine methylase